MSNQRKEAVFLFITPFGKSQTIQLISSTIQRIGKLTAQYNIKGALEGKWRFRIAKFSVIEKGTECIVYCSTPHGFEGYAYENRVDKYSYEMKKLDAFWDVFINCLCVNNPTVNFYIRPGTPTVYHLVKCETDENVAKPPKYVKCQSIFTNGRVMIGKLKRKSDIYEKFVVQRDYIQKGIELWSKFIDICELYNDIVRLKPVVQYQNNFVDLSGFSAVGKGTRYEDYVANYLQEEGYRDVSVTKRSGDYGGDIIAYAAMGAKYCIQCKYYKDPVGVSAIQEVNAAKSYYNADVSAVFTNSNYTKQAQELAAACNVKLFRLEIKRQTPPSPKSQEKQKDNLEWIDRIEDYHAFMDD